MEVPTADTQTQVAPEPPKERPKQVALQVPKTQGPASTRFPSIIVGLVVAAVAGLSIWYLVRGEPLLVQGEVDATRLDIAARVDGRVAEIPVERGQDVAAGFVLVRIDNPETVAKDQQALAAKVVAEAQLANINVGTRVEVVAARKAAMERAQASVVLAQKTYDRVNQLAAAATPHSRGSTKRPTRCMRASAPPTRPNRPTSRRSTATRVRSTRSLRRMSARQSPTSRPFNRLSTRWSSMRRSARRFISAT